MCVRCARSRISWNGCSGSIITIESNVHMEISFSRALSLSLDLSTHSLIFSQCELIYHESGHLVQCVWRQFRWWQEYFSLWLVVLKTCSKQLVLLKSVWIVVLNVMKHTQFFLSSLGDLNCENLNDSKKKEPKVRHTR